MSRFYYGAHMSSSNILKSLREIMDSNGNFIQIFVNNTHGKINPDLLNKYRVIGPDILKMCEKNNLKIVIHSPYTINFAKNISENDNGFNIIFSELQVADMIGAIGTVIHVGKSLDNSIEEATENMFMSIKKIIKFIKENNLKSKIILETAAGQGTELFVTVNNNLRPLTDFYNRFTNDDKKYFKLCIDTCHIFSAGFDIRTKENVTKLFKDLESLNVLNHVALIHFNDSKKDYAERKDRHESIGYGFIGPKGLSYVVKYAYRYNIPLMLETPDETYVNEIPWINDIVKKCKK